MYLKGQTFFPPEWDISSSVTSLWYVGRIEKYENISFQLVAQDSKSRLIK